jgi:hypothetical protein
LILNLIYESQKLDSLRHKLPKTIQERGLLRLFCEIDL